MSVIVIAFTTLDGFVSDPDGSAGSARGGWMFRFGRTAIDGDKFQLSRILQEGALLFGRGTWQQFAKLWPAREGEFAERMNGAAKLVASRSALDVSQWANSSVLDGDLAEAVKSEQRDVVVMGSTSIARQLAAVDLVDEYRLVTVPTVIGAGERLFQPDGGLVEFDFVSSELTGPLVFTRYRRSNR